MDPIATWGLILSVLAAGGVFTAGGAWRTMGRIEGKVERYHDRLNRHSEKIDEHDLALVRVNGLPAQIQRLEDKVEKLTQAIEEGGGPS